MELIGKNIVYVGGTGGIGREACKELMRKNVKNLIVLDKCERTNAFEALKFVDSPTQLHFWYFDVTADVQKMKEIFKEILLKVEKIDVLIYGAGILNECEMERTVKINLMGCINTTVAAFDFMDKRNGGHGGVIVNISSVAGLNGFPTVPVYSATKAGIVNFSLSTAHLESITGIKIFAVCPGITSTSILQNINTFLGFDQTLSTNIAKIKKIQDPEECAKNLIEVIEICENGSIWIIDNNQKSSVEIPAFWQPPEELL